MLWLLAVAVKHSVTRSMVLRQTQNTVFSMIADPAALPSWSGIGVMENPLVRAMMTLRSPNSSIVQQLNDLAKKAG
jgi:hypothetical protein